MSVLIGLLTSGCVAPGTESAELLVDSGQNRFVVTDFGADPSGQEDSTAAIQAAINAAGRHAGPDRRHEVIIPQGTYKVMPAGILHLRIWEKREGIWILAADEATGTRAGSWIVRDADPQSGDGRDGDYFINRNRNRVWRKAAGEWLSRGPLLCGRGEGWRAEFFPPVPEDEEAVWIQYRLTLSGKNRSVLRVTPDANYVSIVQEEGSVLDFRCWGDVDPMDYVVSNAEAGEDLKNNSRVYLRSDGKWWMRDDGTATTDGMATARKTRGQRSQVVVRSAIPPDKWFPEFAGTRNSAHRGNLIVFDRDRGDPRDFHGIWFLNPVWQGNCTVNYKHAWYTLYHDLDEWDINHKGVVFTWGADGNLYDIRLTGGRISGFRGEQVYAGGGLHKEILVDGAEISHSNASAISVSGHLRVRNVYLHHVYNGMENLAHGAAGQFVEVRNSRIDLRMGGKYGIVHIGEPGTRLDIDGLEVTGGDGLYFDAAAHDVRIANSTFTDVGIAIRLWNINSGTYKLKPEWRNFTFRNVEIIARSGNVGFGIFQGQEYQALGQWNIDGLRITGENGFHVTKALYLVSRNPDSMVRISNSDLTDSPNPVTGEGIVPHFGEGNRIPPQILNPFNRAGQVLELLPQVPDCHLTHVPDPPFTGLSLGPMDRYYPGFRFELTIGGRSGPAFTIAADPAWNTFEEDLILRPGESASFLFGQDRRFSLLSP